MEQMSVDELIATGEAVVVLFGAPWVPTTALLRKHIEAQVPATGAVWRYVDCDVDPGLADRRGIVNVPVTVAYAGGRELDRTRGAHGAEEILRLARQSRAYSERVTPGGRT